MVGCLHIQYTVDNHHWGKDNHSHMDSVGSLGGQLRSELNLDCFLDLQCRGMVTVGERMEDMYHPHTVGDMVYKEDLDTLGDLK